MADAVPTSSRRSALRFRGYDRPVTFKTDYDDGEARLVNVSTSGCAIQQPTLELQMEQRLLLSLELDGPDKTIHIRAIVIRLEPELVCLQFQHVEDNTKRRLVRFLAQETRRRKNAQPSAP